MAEIPQNQRLYAMVVTQAKQKYRIYPSPGASHWVHKRYLELGGKFTDTEEENKRKEIAERIMELRKERKQHHHRNSDRRK